MLPHRYKNAMNKLHHQFGLVSGAPGARNSCATICRPDRSGAQWRDLRFDHSRIRPELAHAPAPISGSSLVHKGLEILVQQICRPDRSGAQWRDLRFDHSRIRPELAHAPAPISGSSLVHKGLEILVQQICRPDRSGAQWRDLRFRSRLRSTCLIDRLSRHNLDRSLPESRLLSSWVQYGNLALILTRSKLPESNAKTERHRLQPIVQTLGHLERRRFERLRLLLIKAHECNQRLKSGCATRKLGSRAKVLAVMEEQGSNPWARVSGQAAL